jgi:hypothetical protein
VRHVTTPTPPAVGSTVLATPIGKISNYIHLPNQNTYYYCASGSIVYLTVLVVSEDYVVDLVGGIILRKYKM